MSARAHDDATVEKMAAEYAAGASLIQLRKKYGGSEPSVRKALIRAGVKLRPPGRAPWRDFTPEQGAEIIARWHGDESQTRIADWLGTTQSVISRYLISHGIEPSPRQRNQRGANNSKWKGGAVTRADGYVSVRVEPDDPIAAPMRGHNGYVIEHRLVMARHLGRPLRSDENVHHINGDRADNRIENLELWVRPQPNGQRVVDALAWARELIARYESEEQLLLF